MINGLILIAVVAAAGILLWPRISNNRTWRATITPLASIIGSGFLVLGPILEASYGVYAPLAMAALCGLAYLYGGAIRFNIATIETAPGAQSALEQRIETVSSWALAFAYIISTTYYLNLFGTFGVSLTDMNDALHSRALTTAMLLLILAVGWTRGFSALERMEQVSVGIKLAIITGLLTGLAWYFAHQIAHGNLVHNPATVSGWPALTLFFGLLVTVQGFETSRYLGAEYDAARRVRSMKLAQWISTGIYMTYILLIAFAFTRGTFALTETAIIDVTRIVAPILPVLLVVAALSAQFSAAVADTSGTGGLAEELTGGRIKPRLAYAILVACGIALTWTSNVFEIISYASRAFALYYALQSAIATKAAWRQGKPAPRAALYAGLTVLGLAIAIFGTPVE